MLYIDLYRSVLGMDSTSRICHRVLREFVILSVVFSILEYLFIILIDC